MTQFEKMLLRTLKLSFINLNIFFSSFINFKKKNLIFIVKYYQTILKNNQVYKTY